MRCHAHTTTPLADGLKQCQLEDGHNGPHEHTSPWDNGERILLSWDHTREYRCQAIGPWPDRRCTRPTGHAGPHLGHDA